MPDWLIDIAKQGGVSAGFVIVAIAFYRYIAPAIGRHLKTRQTEGAVKVVNELNGRLVEAVQRALQPLIKETMQDVFDTRFREMPEFIRDKIKGLGEHGGNNAIMIWDDKYKVLSRIGVLEVAKGNVETWKLDYDKGADSREDRVHVMEVALARLDEVQKGQAQLLTMLSDLRDAVSQRNHK